MNKTKQKPKLYSSKYLLLTLQLIALLLFAITSVVSCSSESELDSVEVGIGYGSYTTSNYKWIEWLIPSANATVSDLKVCFKRLRFKLNDEDTPEPNNSEDNIDFMLDEVTIDPAGTYLNSVFLPKGNYKRIEFDLEDDCGTGHSLQVINDSGTHSTTDRITIKFSVDLVADEDQIISLDIQPILNALNSYTGVGSLKDAAESASGSL